MVFVLRSASQQLTLRVRKPLADDQDPSVPWQLRYLGQIQVLAIYSIVNTRPLKSLDVVKISFRISVKNLHLFDHVTILHVATMLLNSYRKW